MYSTIQVYLKLVQTEARDEIKWTKISGHGDNDERYFIICWLHEENKILIQKRLVRVRIVHHCNGVTRFPNKSHVFEASESATTSLRVVKVKEREKRWRGKVGMIWLAYFSAPTWNSSRHRVNDVIDVVV